MQIAQLQASQEPEENGNPDPPVSFCSIIIEHVYRIDTNSYPSYRGHARVFWGSDPINLGKNFRRFRQGSPGFPRAKFSANIRNGTPADFQGLLSRVRPGPTPSDRRGAIPHVVSISFPACGHTRTPADSASR